MGPSMIVVLDQLKMASMLADSLALAASAAATAGESGGPDGFGHVLQKLGLRMASGVAPSSTPDWIGAHANVVLNQ